MLRTAKGGVITNIKTKLFTLTMAATFIASLAVSNVTPFIGRASALTASTVAVSGNTAAGENQPGWLFNRDVSTSTPFEFNTGAASTGNGSVYVKPIGASASDKFIAENFLLTPIANVSSISYDFQVGSGGNASSKSHFYMNVYANFGSSSPTKFYDCRYNIVPTTGSTSSFTTVTFDPAQSYPVSTSGSAPHSCPASPAGMDSSSPGSTIRMFALNVGDTSISDFGLDGYLDKVVVTTTSTATTYNFDPVPPTAPTNGAPHNTHLPTNEFDFTWNASTGGKAPLTYEFQSSLNPAQSGGVLTSGLWHSGVLSSPMIHSSGAPDGTWYWQVRAKDSNGLYSNWSNIWKVTLDHTAPTAPVLISPANNQYFSGTPILNDWTESTDTNGIAKYQVEYIYDDGHTFAGAPYREVPGTQTQRNHTPNTGEQGGVKVRVRAFDPAGNASNWSNQVHYFYDAAAPVVLITNPAAGSVVNNVLVDGTVEDENLNFFNINLVKVGDTNWNFTTQKQQAAPGQTLYALSGFDLLGAAWYGTCDGQPCTTWGGGELPSGEYNIRVNAYDKAGNRTTYSHAFTLDNAAPVVTIDPISNSTDQNRTITGTIDDATATLTVELDGVAQTATIVGNTWSVSLSGLTVGDHTVTAYAEDAAGNVTNPSVEETFTTTEVPVSTNTPNNLQGSQNSSNTPNNPQSPQNSGNAQTLAVTTSTPEVLAAEQSGKSDKKEESTKKIEQVAATNGKFLGLGWWWIAILAFIALLVVMLARRRANEA